MTTQKPAEQHQRRPPNNDDDQDPLLDAHRLFDRSKTLRFAVPSDAGHVSDLQVWTMTQNVRRAVPELRDVTIHKWPRAYRVTAVVGEDADALLVERRVSLAIRQADVPNVPSPRPTAVVWLFGSSPMEPWTTQPQRDVALYMFGSATPKNDFEAALVREYTDTVWRAFEVTRACPGRALASEMGKTLRTLCRSIEGAPTEKARRALQELALAQVRAMLVVLMESNP
jgi:hypothetical protein